MSSAVWLRFQQVSRETQTSCLLYLHIFEAVLELVELVSNVEPHGCTKYTFDESSHESFVPDLDLEVNGSLMLTSMR